MQEPTDISKNVFSEIQKIVDSLSKCKSIDELLTLEEQITTLKDYTAFLKIHTSFLNSKQNLSVTTRSEDYTMEPVEIDDEDFYNENEPSISRSELNVENQLDLNGAEEEEEKKNFSFDEEEFSEDIKYAKLDFENEDEIVYPHEDRHSLENQNETQAEDLEAAPLDIEEAKNDTKDEYISEEEVERLDIKHQEERKFRLSSIKGIKKMETLFEDDFMEESKISDEQPKVGSLTKSNMPLDFMEAEKAKPLFKLDLNDRIAFTKKLFSGSQTDLNNAVSTLNEFDTLKEAKEYLSEMYYEKGWSKEEEFAQRLWNLVESKFQ